MLARLIAHNPDEYQDWSLADLSAALVEEGIEPRKSHGVMVIRADDITAALADRDEPNGRGEPSGDTQGTRGVLPPTPHPTLPRSTPQNPENQDQETQLPGSLPDELGDDNQAPGTRERAIGQSELDADDQ